MKYFKTKTNDIWAFKDRDVINYSSCCECIAYISEDGSREDHDVADFHWCYQHYHFEEIPEEEAKRIIFEIML
jgi:hypothetical protein